MTDTKSRSAVTLSGPQLGIILFVTMIVLLMLAMLVKQHRHRERHVTDRDMVISLAKSHPDVRIRKDLIAAVAAGELDIGASDLRGHREGQFSTVSGKPKITVDTTLLVASDTRPGLETLFAVLTHEYAHYLQWLKLPAMRELHARYDSDTNLTDAQCVLKIAVEDEAYGIACQAAYRYKWNAAIESQCDGIGLSFRAKQFLSGSNDLPECVAVWQSLVAQTIVTPVRLPSGNVPQAEEERPSFEMRTTRLEPPAVTQ